MAFILKRGPERAMTRCHCTYFCKTDQTDHVTPGCGTMACPCSGTKYTTDPFHSNTPVDSMGWGSLLVTDMSSTNVVSDGFYDRAQRHRNEGNAVDERKWWDPKLTWEMQACMRPSQRGPIITWSFVHRVLAMQCTFDISRSFFFEQLTKDTRSSQNEISGVFVSAWSAQSLNLVFFFFQYHAFCSVLQFYIIL